MDGWVGMAVSAAAVIIVPIVGWISQRATREQRLLARITQLGRAHRNLPDSPERNIFAAHLNQSVRAYNEWMDSDSRAARFISRAAAVLYLMVALLVAGATAGIPIIRAIDGLSVLIGASLGALVSLAAAGTSRLAARWAESRRKQRSETAEAIAAKARVEALRIKLSGD